MDSEVGHNAEIYDNTMLTLHYNTEYRLHIECRHLLLKVGLPLWDRAQEPRVHAPRPDAYVSVHTCESAPMLE